jgi:hypothetical protein
MFDFGDGYVTVYSKPYCTDDFGNVVHTGNRMAAAIQYAHDHQTGIKFFER